MSQTRYQPRNCAFHPKELIFNFCKNSECLLPLCPSCVKVHSEEHKTEKSYGQFEKYSFFYIQHPQSSQRLRHVLLRHCEGTQLLHWGNQGTYVWKIQGTVRLEEENLRSQSKDGHFGGEVLQRLLKVSK